MTISFKVNGKKESVEADSDTPLLWVLRDFLDLTGTKFGCGKGVCGACTVHLDGSAIRSCQVPLSAVEGKDVSTIESLGESAPKLLESWVENNVPQCGYCQAGQLMSAAALLSVNAAPKDEDIDQAMSGNICRCGCYPRIKKAIKWLNLYMIPIRGTLISKTQMTS